jgi:hypothetical protein
MPSPQYRWFIVTAPRGDWECCHPESVKYIRGQAEIGEGGYEHWQICVNFNTKTTVTRVRELFGGRAHAEPTRSGAAREYVWKEDTRVEGTQFEYGSMPVRREKKEDWDAVWDAAKTGNFDAIPANIRVCHYSSLRKISADFGRTIALDRSCFLFVGRTGTGKSQRAWTEAGMDAYAKDPRTKFWDGYRGEKHVVIDEFRGSIDVAHILRWFDRYPVRVELKGASTPLLAERFWITSNLPIEHWWPGLDAATIDAVKRRIEVINFN